MEAVTELQMIKAIYRNTKHLQEGLIIVFADNMKIKRAIEDGFQKAIQGLQDESVAIYKIITLIKKMLITIFVEYTNSHEQIK